MTFYHFKRFLLSKSDVLIQTLGFYRVHSYLMTRNQRNSVFVWIPKAAGSSVWTALNSTYCPKLKEPDHVRYRFCQRGCVTFGHQSYPELVSNGLVSKSFDESAFKFCFARNPYDRAVSLFSYLKQLGILHAKLSFKSYCFSLKDGAYDPVGLYNYKNFIICNPKINWILNGEEKEFVDLICKFENLKEDYQKISVELGIPSDLPHINASKRSCVESYYDCETKNIIKSVYQEDLERFGYTFPS